MGRWAVAVAISGLVFAAACTGSSTTTTPTSTIPNAPSALAGFGLYPVKAVLPPGEGPPGDTTTKPSPGDQILLSPASEPRYMVGRPIVTGRAVTGETVHHDQALGWVTDFKIDRAGRVKLNALAAKTSKRQSPGNMVAVAVNYTVVSTFMFNGAHFTGNHVTVAGGLTRAEAVALAQGFAPTPARVPSATSGSSPINVP